MPQGSLRPLKIEEPLPQGAKLVTGENGEILIAFHHGSALLLGPLSRGYIAAWKPAPALIGAAALPLPNNKATPEAATATTHFVLTQGTAFVATENRPLFRRSVTVETPYGTAEVAGGAFSLMMTREFLEVVSLFGQTKIDARRYSQIPNDTQLEKCYIGGARQVRVLPIGAILAPALIDGDTPAGQSFVSSAVFVMEAASRRILTEEAIDDVTSSLAQVGKAGDVQMPIIVKVGRICAGYVMTGRLRPAIAGAFTQSARAHGLAVGNETMAEIENAMLKAPPPEQRERDQLVAKKANVGEKIADPVPPPAKAKP
jgi:hypothetical protein